MPQITQIVLTANTMASATINAKEDTVTSNEDSAVYVAEEHRINRVLTGFTAIHVGGESTIGYRFDGADIGADGSDNVWLLPPGSARSHDGIRAKSVTVVALSQSDGVLSIEGQA
jgi:hypothetical protein